MINFILNNSTENEKIQDFKKEERVVIENMLELNSSKTNINIMDYFKE